MIAAKREGKEELVFKCKGFKNPIQKELWYGFKVSFFDGEDPFNTILYTDKRVVIDATTFNAPTLSLRNIIITPKVPKVAEFTVWTLTIA